MKVPKVNVPTERIHLHNPTVVKNPHMVNRVTEVTSHNNPYLSYRRKLRYDMFRR